MLFVVYLLLLCGCVVYVSCSQRNHEDTAYWKKLADDDLNTVFTSKLNENTAKNVILFIGDGMGPNTVTTARIYGKTETGYLAFEKFPHIGVLKTYSANKYVPDSCSTATALFCGVKANQKTAGVDASVAYRDCDASLKTQAQTKSVFVWAQDVGKATGFVTTTRVTHATPSALYAHTPDRKWECEATIPTESQHCKDIARQLIEDAPGRNINVIMGGGRQVLQSNVSGSDADPIDTWACYRQDGRDLIADWVEEKIARNVSYAFVGNNRELGGLNLGADFVLGVFANGHLKMEHERDRGMEGMPSLSNMTAQALQVLRKNEKGFVLVVEGGLIDFAHHRGHAKQALSETIEFSNAIQTAIDIFGDDDETLIIVTSDHSHSLVFSGYVDRGESVLDIAQASKMNGQNYTSLLYGTGGPDNYKYTANNGTILWEDPKNTEDYNYAQQSAILTDEVTHSGTDVLVYAKGAHAHLFQSVHEQTHVAYVMAYAMKIGPYKSAAVGVKSALVVTLAMLLKVALLQ